MSDDRPSVYGYVVSGDTMHRITLQNNIAKNVFDTYLVDRISLTEHIPNRDIKECMSDSVTNYNYVGDTKVNVSIKKANANKCTLSEIFLSEILKSFSAF